MAACLDDQQPSFKHYCRVCKKGFMCGRALGGHMRAHGIGDDPANLDDDNASDWEDNKCATKRMYQLRTNPNRLKSCRTCENCGKEFLSWKSFLEHGNAKCTSDDASDSLDSDDRRATSWSKRKRSLRSKVTEDDDLLLATCLVQLANTTVDLPLVEPEESCASASKEEDRRNSSLHFKARAPDHKKACSPRGVFECKACKKVFNSHQALGGHRASHKKVKGCYAAKQDEADDNNSNSLLPPPEKDATPNNDQEISLTKSSTFQLLVGAARRKFKVHECSICHRVFNSGQALGGHKRCHWIISNSPETSSMAANKFQLQEQHQNRPHSEKQLDLNVPAWAHITGVRRDPRNPLSFDVSTDMHLQPWNSAVKNVGDDNKKKDEEEKKVKSDVDDEADSKLKLAKLSDLNDTNVASSQWLQVGIGSTTEAAAAAGDTA